MAAEPHRLVTDKRKGKLPCQVSGLLSSMRREKVLSGLAAHYLHGLKQRAKRWSALLKR
jgi:hypothetical protein